MTQQFKPVEVGEEFPAVARGPKKKYVTDEAMNLLFQNKGKVFLIVEIKNLGTTNLALSNVSTSMRHSGKYKKLEFEGENPNFIFDYAVRQTVKEDGGVVRMYARISEKWLKHIY